MKRAAMSLGLGIVLLASPASAAPPTPDQCAQAAEDGQRLRDTTKLRRAREKFLECAAEACPTVVRKDCIRWATEIEGAIPTIVVRARDKRGHDVSGARVAIDGEVVRERLDGTAIPVDPGEHVITVTAKSGDRAEQQVVLSRTERDRALTFDFASALETNGMGYVEPPPPPPAIPEKSYVLPIFLAGGAAVALGVFGVFDAHAYSKYQEYEDGCGKTAQKCASGDVDALRTELRVAGVALVTGVVLAGAATYFFLFPPAKSPVSATARGAVLRF